ncbi:hypothetical protein ACO0LO_07480 [Undibacterium sp. TJN25]|uniref:hypothetical protein n=1 Tax=Undibacterium sp. TJN25 TaxID=3413056 RepID=UPI003BF0A13D
MKTSSKFQFGPVLAGIVAGAVLVTASAFHGSAGIQTAAAEQIPTVTIVGKRMTAEEKLAYDMQQPDYVHTVVLTAKRLTAEEKQAMADEDQRMQQLLAKRAARSAQKAG